MQFLKITIGSLILLIGLPIFVFFILKILPTSIQYHSEINYGNDYVQRLWDYKKQHGKLPESSEYEILFELNHEPSKEHFYPQYTKMDENNFSLTYILGFDGPYLTYNTEAKLWELRK